MLRAASLLAVLSIVSGCATPHVIDRTTQASAICGLHHIQMTRQRVSLYASGQGAPPHDYSRCPHAKRPIDTGCIGWGFGAYGYIWVCPACQGACAR